jgi:ribonucleoside-diphosphate reductase alpha chain
MNQPDFETDISRHVWKSRYCLCNNTGVIDEDVAATWRRVAHALASLEGQPDEWEERFYTALKDFRFIPGGRILAGAGSHHDITLFNCFVMGRIEDSRTGIDQAIQEGARTMQHGGGVGYDFSTLRPRGCTGWESGEVAAGPVAFMNEWDSMCAQLLSGEARRGAMMGTLRCDHPDIEEFIDGKREASALSNFNLSVLVSDAFMQAVQSDEDWALIYPEETLASPDRERYPEQVEKTWSGSDIPTPCRVFRYVRARQLWEALMRANYETAEPGVLFIDRINQLNNLAYREQISATNPCGEIPLPYYGACDLGSINLSRFVKKPFSADAHVDLEGLSAITQIAVRMLDNVIDLSKYPLEQQRLREQADRRIGLGITGLADTLIMLGLHYGEPSAREQAATIMKTICHCAYRSSIALAREKGSFPSYDREGYLASAFIQSLPNEIRQDIAQSGIRNSHLLAIAPTGTISLLANNISSGIEPVFQFEYQRRVRDSKADYQDFALVNYAVRQWRMLYPQESLPAYFITADELTPASHLLMQKALQPFVDNAISKTIHVNANITYDDFTQIYAQAYAFDLKGCTIYHPNPVRGAVLTSRKSQF